MGPGASFGSLLDLLSQIRVSKQREIPFDHIGPRRFWLRPQCGIKCIVKLIFCLWWQFNLITSLTCSVCHLTTVRSGALISVFPDGGRSPVRIGGILGRDIDETLLENNGGVVDDGRLAGCGAAGASVGAEHTRNIGWHAPDGQH